MEFKQYVVLIDKTILNLETLGHDFIMGKTPYIVNDNKDMLFKENKIAKVGYVEVTEEVVKSSDSLLVLADVGDLIELRGGEGKINDVHMIINSHKGDIITYDDLLIYKDINGDKVVAIYKKLLNGDFKRYEVKKV